MNFKIECENFVMLYELEKVVDVNASVLNYDLIDDVLKGNVEVKGMYLKKDHDKTIPFSDVIPFTVVFGKDDVVIKNVEVVDLVYDITNDGINTKFKVDLDYTTNESSEVNEVDNNIDFKENNDELSESHNYDLDNNIDKDIIEPNNQMNNLELIENELEDEFIQGKNDEEVTKEYEEKLNEILNGRNDDVLESNEEKIKPCDNDSNANITLKKVIVPYTLKFTEKKSKLRVIYYKDDKELEQVSKEQNVSINVLLNDSQNVGDIRRIILKD